MSVPSSSQVKKAGSTIRKHLRGELGDPERAQAALEVMEEWRGAHYIPLVSANNGLRSRARTIGVEAEVTQRLKRSQTILDKVRRQPTLTFHACRTSADAEPWLPPRATCAASRNAS